MTAASPAFRYGFRYDPMSFVENDPSLQGALVRRLVFQRPLQGDQAILDQRINEILAEQNDDGTLSDDEQHCIQFTAERLLELIQLGVSPDRPGVQRAIEALLREPNDEGGETLGLYGVHALCLLGVTEAPRVIAGLQSIIEREEEWNGPDKGCPWTPEVHLQALWACRELAHVEPLVAGSLTWIADGLNEAGCLSYKDPWGFLDCAGLIDLPAAKRIVERQVPMILRGQRADGGWGEHSLAVFRALAAHGLLEPLRQPPPLPPDWELVRSVPAPEGELFTMTWDGERLWVYRPETGEAIAVSPADGAVVKTVKLQAENIFGIAWWDDALAATQTDPKRLLQINPETGQIRRQVPLDTMEWVHGATRVNGRFWVADGFLCSVCRLDPANPDDAQWLVLAGPGPASLAAEPDGVWHSDFWAPAIIKSDFEGGLLDWGERPLDGRCDGLAWDGENLWALDSEQHRICLIEKAARQ